MINILVVVVVGLAMCSFFSHIAEKKFDWHTAEEINHRLFYGLIFAISFTVTTEVAAPNLITYEDKILGAQESLTGSSFASFDGSIFLLPTIIVFKLISGLIRAYKSKSQVTALLYY